jgi:hypothetical protein
LNIWEAAGSDEEGFSVILALDKVVINHPPKYALLPKMWYCQ